MVKKKVKKKARRSNQNKSLNNLKLSELGFGHKSALSNEDASGYKKMNGTEHSSALPYLYQHLEDGFYYEKILADNGISGKADFFILIYNENISLSYSKHLSLFDKWAILKIEKLLHSIDPKILKRIGNIRIPLHIVFELSQSQKYKKESYFTNTRFFIHRSRLGADTKGEKTTKAVWDTIKAIQNPLGAILQYGEEKESIRNLDLFKRVIEHKFRTRKSSLSKVN